MNRFRIGERLGGAAISLIVLGLIAAGCGGGGGGSNHDGPATLTPTPTETPGDLCGNGVIDEDESEECDGSALGGETCKSLDYDGGKLACDDDCLFDEDGCFFAE